MTSNAEMKSVLLFAPHADDELLGAGGLLKKMASAGWSVHLVLVACSDVKMHHCDVAVPGRVRKAEFAKSADALGSKFPTVLGHEDTKLDAVPMAVLVSEFDRILRSFSPNVVLVPDPSYHQDHKAVFAAAMAALRPTAPWRPETVAMYEVPTSTWSDPWHPFMPNLYVDIDAEWKAKQFVDCYGSQVGDRGALTAEGIIAHAAYRGVEAGIPNAEAFQLLRCVIKSGNPFGSGK